MPTYNTDKKYISCNLQWYKKTSFTIYDKNDFYSETKWALVHTCVNSVPVYTLLFISLKACLLLLNRMPRYCMYIFTEYSGMCCILIICNDAKEIY